MPGARRTGRRRHRGGPAGRPRRADGDRRVAADGDHEDGPLTERRLRELHAPPAPTATSSTTACTPASAIAAAPRYMPSSRRRAVGPLLGTATSRPSSTTRCQPSCGSSSAPTGAVSRRGSRVVRCSSPTRYHASPGRASRSRRLAIEDFPTLGPPTSQTITAAPPAGRPAIVPCRGDATAARAGPSFGPSRLLWASPSPARVIFTGPTPRRNVLGVGSAEDR